MAAVPDALIEPAHISKALGHVPLLTARALLTEGGDPRRKFVASLSAAAAAYCVALLMQWAVTPRLAASRGARVACAAALVAYAAYRAARRLGRAAAA